MQNDSREPLITVIKVPGGHLLNNDTAVIDMPGINGALKDQPLQKWLPRRCDFILDIHSTIAAITPDEEERLRNLFANLEKKPPVWILHNQIDAKYWRNTDDRDFESNASINEKRRQLEQTFRVRNIMSESLNLGKVDDAANWLPQNPGVADELKTVLREELTKFENFESHLATFIHQDREIILEHNALNGMCGALKKAQEALAETLTRLRQELQNHDAVKAALHSAKGKCAGIAYDLRSVVTEVTERAQGEARRWNEDTVTKMSTFKQLHGVGCSGKIYNQDLDDLARTMGTQDNMTVFFNTHGPFGSEIQRKCAEALSASEKQYRQDCKELLAAFSRTLQHHTGWTPDEVFPEPPPLSIDDLPALIMEPFNFGDAHVYVWKGVVLLFVDSFWNATELGTRIDTVVAGKAKVTIEERTKDWLRRFTAFLESHCTTKRSTFHQQFFQDLADKYMANTSRECTTLSNSAAFVEMVQGSLHNLDSVVREAKRQWDAR